MEHVVNLSLRVGSTLIKTGKEMFEIRSGEGPVRRSYNF